MSVIYKIKEGHPIKEVIYNEVYNSYYKDNNIDIGVCVTNIEDSAICSVDIYDFKFNSNNSEVPCINLRVFTKETSKNVPKILNDDQKGYDYYKSCHNITIKLKTFLEKNPEWVDLNTWTTIVGIKKDKCKYDGHNNDDREAAIRRPDGKKYIIPFPEGEKNGANILDWIKPYERQLTKQYYRNISLDKLNNIKRNLSVYVEGLIFHYDYINGNIDIRDICNYNGSIFKNLMGVKIINISIGLPKETMRMIKLEIESGDIEVKDIIIGGYRPEKKRINIEV